MARRKPITEAALCRAVARVIEDRSCISDEVLHEQISLAILTATMDEDVSLALRQKIHDSVFKTIDHIFPKQPK